MRAISKEQTTNLIFDEDDTLCGVQELYDGQRGVFVALMEQQGLGPGPIVEQLAGEINMQQYAIRGVSPPRFPESLVATYRSRCKQLNQPEDARFADQVKKIGEGFLTWVLTFIRTSRRDSSSSHSTASSTCAVHPSSKLRMVGTTYGNACAHCFVKSTHRSYHRDSRKFFHPRLMIDLDR